MIARNFFVGELVDLLGKGKIPWFVCILYEFCTALFFFSLSSFVAYWHFETSTFTQAVFWGVSSKIILFCRKNCGGRWEIFVYIYICSLLTNNHTFIHYTYSPISHKLAWCPQRKALYLSVASTLTLHTTLNPTQYNYSS